MRLEIIATVNLGVDIYVILKPIDKSLPHGKDVCGKELQEDLNNILSVYVSNAERIAPAASKKDLFPVFINNIIHTS